MKEKHTNVVFLFNNFIDMGPNDSKSMQNVLLYRTINTHLFLLDITASFIFLLIFLCFFFFNSLHGTSPGDYKTLQNCNATLEY